jgi:hypothetical protein
VSPAKFRGAPLPWVLAAAALALAVASAADVAAGVAWLRRILLWSAPAVPHSATGTAATLFFSALAGALVPWVARPSDREWELVRASSFLAAAGALMMLVVGNELARAFGLMGAASVVRYRYGLRSPRDASSLILALSLGMAAGAGMIGLAISATVALLLLQVLFERMGDAPGGGSLGRHVHVEVRGRSAELDRVARAFFERNGLMAQLVECEGKEVPSVTATGGRGDGTVYKLVYEVRLPAGMGPLALIQGISGEGISEVHLRDRVNDRG